MREVTASEVQYRVGFFRQHGFEAKWGKANGRQPCLFVKHAKAKYRHQRERFWLVDANMWRNIQHGMDPLEAFDQMTLLGDIFSVPV